MIMQFSRFKNSLALHTVLFIFAVAVGYGSVRSARQGIIAYQERAANREKIEALTQRKRMLEEELTRLQSPGVEEREAKERLNLKLPGEQVVVVLPDKLDAMEVKQSPSTSGWWRWIRLWLRDLL